MTTKMTDEFRKELELIITRQKRRIDRLVKMNEELREEIEGLKETIESEKGVNTRWEENHLGYGRMVGDE